MNASVIRVLATRALHTGHRTAAALTVIHRNGIRTSLALSTGRLITVTPLLAAIDPHGEHDLTRYASWAGRSIAAAHRAQHGRNPSQVWAYSPKKQGPIQVSAFNPADDADRAAIEAGLLGYRRTLAALTA